MLLYSGFPPLIEDKIQGKDPGNGKYLFYYLTQTKLPIPFKIFN